MALVLPRSRLRDEFKRMRIASGAGLVGRLALRPELANDAIEGFDLGGEVLHFLCLLGR